MKPMDALSNLLNTDTSVKTVKKGRIPKNKKPKLNTDILAQLKAKSVGPMGKVIPQTPQTASNSQGW